MGHRTSSRNNKRRRSGFTSGSNPRRFGSFDSSVQARNRNIALAGGSVRGKRLVDPLSFDPDLSTASKRQQAQRDADEIFRRTGKRLVAPLGEGSAALAGINSSKNRAAAQRRADAKKEAARQSAIRASRDRTGAIRSGEPNFFQQVEDKVGGALKKYQGRGTRSS